MVWMLIQKIDVPIYIKETSDGLVADNAGPGIEITEIVNTPNCFKGTMHIVDYACFGKEF